MFAIAEYTGTTRAGFPCYVLVNAPRALLNSRWAMRDRDHARVTLGRPVLVEFEAEDQFVTPVDVEQIVSVQLAHEPRAGTE